MCSDCFAAILKVLIGSQGVRGAKMNCKMTLAYAIAAMVLISSLIAFTGGAIASDGLEMTEGAALDPSEDAYPATGWNVVEHDVPSGYSYFLW